MTEPLVLTTMILTHYIDEDGARTVSLRVQGDLPDIITGYGMLELAKGSLMAIYEEAEEG